jgi:hypothetical protein
MLPYEYNVKLSHLKKINSHLKVFNKHDIINLRDSKFSKKF